VPFLSAEHTGEKKFDKSKFFVAQVKLKLNIINIWLYFWDFLVRNLKHEDIANNMSGV
jgi:hypothetical protein